MKILIYYPNSRETIPFNSLLPKLNKNGNELLILTLSPRGKLHEDLESRGIKTFYIDKNERPRFLFFISHVFFLIRFCWKNKIDIVFSHINPTNIIAVIAQYFIKSKVVIFRHHFDYILEPQKKPKFNNEQIGLNIINILAKKIVVPCSTVYNGMVKYESVRPSKLSIIPYYYDFNLYPIPQADEVARIRQQYGCKLLLLLSARMFPLKRHILGLEILLNIVRKNYDVKLIISDEGPEKNNLLKFVSENNLNDKVFFIGFTTQIINYMKACDILIHPSLTEASSSTVKEVGLQEKVVIACNGVGDFDDYLMDGFNGFLVSPESTMQEMEKIIVDLYDNDDKRIKIGKELRKTILDKFSISESGTKLYDQLLINH
jgi:glycosyltransferase involved in cell wall biosynthesis